MKTVGNLIEIVHIKERKDGSADMQYTVTDNGLKAFKELAKTQKKKFTKAFINKTILNSLKEAVKPGFSLGS